MTESKEVIYREVQYFRQIWAVILVLGIAIYMWYALVQQLIYGVPVGDNPAPDIVLWEEINRYEAITYNSLQRFGGWGIGFGTVYEVAYNISGDKAVELHMKNKVIVIGTKDIDGLMKAIDSVGNVQNGEYK